ncbi:MAG: anaerobic ribonucleoside-triphosphate reductase activating protein [Lachnospiraceae bacterium]|nr:anaerobic ribonucleoside-triphosphate reductase activating protein [Lachnospiraceae bacterium]
MNYCNIKKTDIADGPGVRVTLFVSGCTHHCRGCFQPETWDFDYGDPFTEETKRALLEALSPDYIAGLSLLGGEPFEPDNQRALLPILRQVRKSFPDKTIWAYSGYELEELAGWAPGLGRARCEATDEMLSLIDVLVDGEFMQEKKNITLLFRGSENQRLIDVKTSMARGSVVLWGE